MYFTSSRGTLPICSAVPCWQSFTQDQQLLVDSLFPEWSCIPNFSSAVNCRTRSRGRQRLSPAHVDLHHQGIWRRLPLRSKTTLVSSVYFSPSGSSLHPSSSNKRHSLALRCTLANDIGQKCVTSCVFRITSEEHVRSKNFRGHGTVHFLDQKKKAATHIPHTTWSILCHTLVSSPTRHLRLDKHNLPLTEHIKLSSLGRPQLSVCGKDCGLERRQPAKRRTSRLDVCSHHLHHNMAWHCPTHAHALRYPGHRRKKNKAGPSRDYNDARVKGTDPTSSD